MPYTTVTLRHDVAERLRATRDDGESFSDVINRLLDSQPAKTVGDWLASLTPLEGRSLFTPGERAQLKRDQQTPRDSRARRKAHAAA